MGKYDKKRTSGSKPYASGGNPKVSDNPELDEVARWLASVKFKKKLLGGLDPADVWKKLEELNALYENAIVAERARYNLLLNQMPRLDDPEEYK